VSDREKRTSLALRLFKYPNQEMALDTVEHNDGLKNSLKDIIA